MNKKLSALALLLTLSLALSACGENHGDGDSGVAAPSSSESASTDEGDDLPLPAEDDGLAEAIVNEGDATFAEEAAADEVPAAAPSAEDSVIVPPTGASRTALLGSNLQTVKIIIEQTQALAVALESESAEYFRTHEGHATTRRVMAQNTGRIEMNLRRASVIVNTWYEHGSEPLANTARFRNSYSRLRAHLRRALQLGNITRRIGRRSPVVASFDPQLAAIVSGTTGAITELNSVVGRVRAPRARATSR